MRIHGFDWDEKNEEHIARHGVAIFEVEEAILFDKAFYQRSREDKYVAYAVTEEDRYLFIVFAVKGKGRIRVITARDMTAKRNVIIKSEEGDKMKKIPKFKTEEEEARFWETHSPLDYPEEFTDVKEPLEFSSAFLKKVAKRRAERKRLLTLRMGQHQIDLAKVIARYRGLGYQTLMRMWVIEGIHREMKIHPELRKLLASK